jgi:hypothetical protein
MPLVGFETTTSVFQQAKIVQATDRAATVTGVYNAVVRVKVTCRFFAEIIHFLKRLTQICPSLHPFAKALISPFSFLKGAEF